MLIDEAELPVCSSSKRAGDRPDQGTVNGHTTPTNYVLKFNRGFDYKTPVHWQFSGSLAVTVRLQLRSPDNTDSDSDGTHYVTYMQDQERQ